MQHDNSSGSEERTREGGPVSKFGTSHSFAPFELHPLIQETTHQEMKDPNV